VDKAFQGKYRRASARLDGAEYRRGFFFVTANVQNRRCLFGDVVDGEMVLSPMGDVARVCWEEIPDHFGHARLDAFVIMPNHVHGIVMLDGDDSSVNDPSSCRAEAMPRLYTRMAMPRRRSRTPRAHNVRLFRRGNE
jgi:REP element-mobilizing transposase RayT